MRIKRQVATGFGAVLLFCVTYCFAEAAVAPALPKDVQPLPAELAARMKELFGEAEKYRGLKFKLQVPCGALDEPVLKKKMWEAIADELPPAKMRVLETGLKSFGLIPEPMNLAKYYPELLTSQVGGFYDPKQRYLVLVRREGGLLPPELKKQYGQEISQRMEETVLVHELTHALQDQYFNLQKFTAGEPLSDEAAAKLALVEGDATLAMYNYFSGMKLEDLPMVEQMIKELLKDPRRIMDMSPDIPSSKELAAAPAWFRDSMFFTYLNGYLFCMSVKKLGGQKLLDYAFSQDPPRSSAQILHPEKWHTQRSDPVVIVWPDLSKELPEYQKTAEGQLGEVSIKTLLQEQLKDNERAASAAAGWRGDRFAVYEKNGARVLAWITEWETEKDCAKFQPAAAALGAGWQAERAGAKRVAVIRGKLTDAELAALKAKLAEAKAIYPQNKNIDLAALGIESGQKTDELGLGDLLNNPLVKDIANKMLKGEGDKEGKPGLGGLLNNPQVQEMVKGMLGKEQPAGEVSQDGRTYTNAQLGLSIKLPDALKDWKLDGKPAIPMAAVAINSPDGGVQINVISQAMPIAISLELMETALEMGPQMIMEGYKKISGGVIEKNGRKGYELQYEGAQNNQKLRAIQRVFTQGTAMLVLSAVAPVDKWKDNEKAILETLGAFVISEPKPEDAASKKK